MSRRKIKKPATKRQSNNMFATIIKMEKDILKTPKKLAAQLNKETVSLKQKDSKLKKAINKIKDQVKNSEKQVQSIIAKGKSSSSKKQLDTAKKIFNKKINAETLLLKQSNEIKKSLETIARTQARLIAMSKHLAQFQKDWVAQSKNDVKKNTHVKPKTISKKSTTIIENMPQIEPTMPRLNDVSIDETSEMAS